MESHISEHHSELVIGNLSENKIHQIVLETWESIEAEQFD